MNPIFSFYEHSISLESHSNQLYDQLYNLHIPLASAEEVVSGTRSLSVKAMKGWYHTFKRPSARPNSIEWEDRIWYDETA